MLILYIILIIIIFFTLNNIFIYKELFSFMTIPMEENTSNKIPLILYKTGPYKTPPEYLINIFIKNENKLNVNKTIYFNNEDCIKFMKDYGPKYYEAYNSLIPNAFKADLWRYCILYKNGGIYGDMTQEFLKDYDVNKENVDMVLVKDGHNNNIQISFIATIKNNNFFKYLIDDVVDNILKKNKGTGVFDITGPTAFGRNFLKFFSVNHIPLGIYSLKGIDNKDYKIRIDMKQSYRSFLDIYTDEKIVKTKMKGHDMLIMKKGIQPKYWKLYTENKIFK